MEENWVRLAITDDNLVAELLLRLNQPDLRPSRRVKQPPTLPPRCWGMRQPRSKAAPSMKKEQDSRRRSPTTPLSWTTSGLESAAASPTGSCEESSRRRVSAARFKGNATTDKTNSSNSSKRSRRKKTFAELKEEESSLLKDRKHLNKQLVSLHMKLEEQRSLHDNLKRIKLDLRAPSATVNEHMGQHNNNGHPERGASTSEAASNVSKKAEYEKVPMPRELCPIQNGPSNEQPPVFVLPDLNMIPCSWTCS